MAQFDVFPNPNKASRDRIPYLICLQHDLLEGLAHVVVAPLRHGEDDIPMLELNPIVNLEGVSYIVQVQDLAAIPRRKLGKAVASLATERDALLAALDFLFTGF